MTYHPSLIFLEEKKNQVMLRLLAQFQITRGLLEILAIGFLPENSISNLFFFKIPRRHNIHFIKPINGLKIQNQLEKKILKLKSTMSVNEKVKEHLKVELSSSNETC
jgi:hypothetical protein